MDLGLYLLLCSTRGRCLSGSTLIKPLLSHCSWNSLLHPCRYFFPNELEEQSILEVLTCAGRRLHRKGREGKGLCNCLSQSIWLLSLSSQVGRESEEGCSNVPPPPKSSASGARIRALTKVAIQRSHRQQRTDMPCVVVQCTPTFPLATSFSRPFHGETTKIQAALFSSLFLMIPSAEFALFTVAACQVNISIDLFIMTPSSL